MHVNTHDALVVVYVILKNADGTVCVAPTRYMYVRAYVLCFLSLGTPSLGGGVSRL
jgi:multimeric flavodoxin WrbA